MTSAAVLIGGSSEIEAQAREISGFLRDNPLGETDVWVLSDDSPGRFELPCAHGHKIFSARISRPLILEQVLDILVCIYREHIPARMIFGSDAFCEALAVRSACRLGGSFGVKVSAASVIDGRLEIKKAVYANNLGAEIRLKNEPYCIGVSKGFSGKAEAFDLEKFDMPDPAPFPAGWVISADEVTAERTEKTFRGDVLAVVGRGIGSKLNAERFEAFFSEEVRADIGASRPAALNAWVGMERLVGASGAVLSPRICVAAGVSGSAAFMAGIEKSGLIISINTDDDALIFRQADVGIVGDCNEIIAELKKIAEENL